MLRIGGVAVLLPRYGMRGFLAVILLSSFYTCAANTGHAAFQRYRGTLSAAGWVRRCWRLLPPVRQGRGAPGADGLSSTGAVGTAGSADGGGTVTAIVFLLAALPLGLWEELRAVLRQARPGKTGESDKNVNFLDTGGDCEYNTNV